MKKKLIPYFAALAVLPAIAGCEQANIYTDVDFDVTLDPSNTYQAGDPVVFNIKGNPDNLLFYSGESGHEYQYRDRYQTTAETVDSAVLFMQVQHRQGSTDALEIYYTDQFSGLAGNDAAADRATVTAMYDGGMEGWTRIPYSKPKAESNVYDTLSVKLDDNAILNNFCLAFYWNPPQPDPGERLFMDTYWLNGNLSVYFPGDAVMTYTVKSMMGQTIMLDEAIENPYLVSDGNGSIRLDATQDIVFAGGYYIDNPGTEAENDGVDHYCNGWIFSVPRAFLTIEPDEGVVVKNLQNYTESFEYSFEEPGTYTVTFVGANENYLGSSSQVKEFKVNIIPPVIEVPDDGTSGDGSQE